MVEAVRTRRDFSALSHSRTRGRSGPVWVVRADLPADPGDGSLDLGTADGSEHSGPDHIGSVQVAYAIGRLVGGAVVRNRVRRRLRTVMTDLERAGSLDPGLYLVGVKPAAVAEPYRDLAGHLEHALEAIR